MRAGRGSCPAIAIDIRSRLRTRRAAHHALQQTPTRKCANYFRLMEIVSNRMIFFKFFRIASQ
jgi:hypothetical protein